MRPDHGNSRRRRTGRADYGFDGSPAGAVTMAAAGIALVGLARLSRQRRQWCATAACGLGGAATLAVVALYVHATRRGKFTAWTEILDGLALRGDERVLDVGCGRGAVLVLAAKRLPTGHAVGLDRWTADQSGNRPAATHRNLEVEAVAGRCHLVTGDMLALPFADGTFDLALSGLAVHNVGRRPSRPGSNPLRALDEVVRVLAPGGRMAIVDLFGVPSYARHLAELGMAEVSERALGWRVRFAPGVAARLVTARKP